MNKLKSIFSARKIAIFLMVAVSALILVACGPTSKVPYGSLGDDAYITIGNYTVSERQLYDQLRTSSINRLNTYIEEIVFADVPLDTANLSQFEVKAFEQEINTALFSSAAITPEQLNDFPDNVLAQRILSFADSFVITNPRVDKGSVTNFLDAVVTDVIARYSAVDFDKDAPFVFGYVNAAGYAAYADVIAEMINQYKLPVLKKVYAKSYLGSVVGSGLEGDINDEKSSAYISEAHAVTYYRNNMVRRYDTSALIIRFDSVLENEIALRKHSIKSNSRGEWYRIPNIADQDIIDILQGGSSHPLWSDAGYHQKALDILVNDLKQDPSNLKTVDYRTADFATYYSKYVINSTTDAALLLDDAPGNNQVLEVFLAIYDDLYDTTFAADFIAGTVTTADLAQTFKMEYSDARFTATAELRNTIYNMDSNVLYDGGNGRNDNDQPYSKPYSRQVQTIGGAQYLLFLFEDNRADDKDILDETDPEDVKFADTEAAQAILLEAYTKLIEQRLTTAYIKNKVTEKFEDVKVNIYDPIIRELYKNQYNYSGSEGFKDSDTLLDVNGAILTVDAFFEYIEDTLGLSTALDIIFVQKLRDAYSDEISDDDLKDFRKQFETQYVNPFLANQYASAGFPADMGIEKFLLLGFGAWANNGRSATQDAIDKIYVQQELRRLFQEDLTVHFGHNTEENNIYTKFAELANTLRANDVSIEASHLLFQIDLDRDGQPDDPNELDQATRDELELLIQELIVEINKRAKLAPSITTGLQNVVQAYNSATRYELTTVTFPGPGATEEEINEYINGFNREDVWVKFKKAGIKLLFQDLGAISNQTNFPGSQGTLDSDFYAFAINMAQYIKDEVTTLDNGIAPTQEEMTRRANALLPMYSPAFIESDVKIVSDGNAAVRTAFGWHLVVARSYTYQQSARLEAVSDAQRTEYTSKVDNPYVADTKLVGYNNDSSDITWEQILIFIEEGKEETGVITLPTSLQTTISKYFSPIFSQTRYLSTYAQLEIAFLYIFDGNVQLADATQNLRLQVLREANFNQFFSYAYFDGIDGTGTTMYDRAYNASFAASYGDFFTVLHG
jgi:hypothetical protein